MIDLKKLLTKILNWFKYPLLYSSTAKSLFYKISNAASTIAGIGITQQGSGVNHGLWSWALDRWLVYSDSSTVYVNGYNMTPVTLTSGWFTRNTTNTSAASSTTLVKWGNVVQFHITWTNKSEISVTAAGNISDIVIGTISEDYRPRNVAVACYGNGNGHYGSVWYFLGTDGEITLSALEGRGSSRTVDAGTTFYCRGFYVR